MRKTMIGSCVLCGVIIAVLVILLFIIAPLGKNSMSDEMMDKKQSFTLDVSTHTLLLNEKNNTVCFYVVTSAQQEEVKLYNRKDNQLLGELKDDGNGYDEDAGDLIYTTAICIDTSMERSLHFVAKVGKIETDVQVVSVVAPLTDEELNDISIVDASLDSLMQNAELYNMEYTARKEAAEELLGNLGEKGLIDEDSIYVDDENEYITFYYTSGVIGSVNLRKQSESEFSLGTPVQVLGQDVTETEQNQYAYIEQSETESVDVLFLYAWFDEYGSDRYSEEGMDKYTYYRDDLMDVADLCTSYGFKKHFDENVTIEDIKRLSDYEFVTINAHGIYQKFIWKTGERYWFFFEKRETVTTSGFMLQEKATTEKDKQYSADLKTGRIIKCGTNYIILPAFFDEHYGVRDLENTIIFFGSCQIMGKEGVFTEEWTDVLTTKSIKAFTAFHNSVIIRYSHDMCASVLEALSKGETMAQAVEYAKEQNGQTDEDWCVRKGWESKEAALKSKNEEPSAYINLRGNSETRIVLSSGMPNEEKKITVGYYPATPGDRLLTGTKTYDETGNLIGETTYTYNDKNQLVRISWGDPDQWYALDYDDKGNLLSKSSQPKTHSIPTLPGDSGDMYTYDVNGRLESWYSWEGGMTGENYIYDIDGRHIGTKCDLDVMAADVQYTYDERGLVVRGQESSVYRADDPNRETVISDETVYTYRYDASGRCVGMTQERNGSSDSCQYDYSYKLFVLQKSSGSEIFMFKDKNGITLDSWAFQDSQILAEDGYLKKVVSKQKEYPSGTVTTITTEFIYQDEQGEVNTDQSTADEMTFEEARKVARDYWKLTDGENVTEEGIKVTVFGDEKDFVESNGTKYYFFTYRALIGDSHWSTWDQVYVNAITGECTYDSPVS